jgi:uncharacterized protein
VKRVRLGIAGLIFAVLLVALWFGLRGSGPGRSLGEEFPRAFASFALLFAPLWFFGFGVAAPAKELSGGWKIAAASLLSLAYFAFAAGSAAFNLRAAFTVIAFPVGLAAFLEIPKLGQKMTWRDGVVLAIIAAAYYLKWFEGSGSPTPFPPGAWPRELALLPKLFLADVALYCFLLVRRLEGSGYWLVPSRSAFLIGLREWGWFLPVALLLGESTGFIHFHAGFPPIGRVVAAILLTFLWIAIPEELFFRSILENFLETRIGRTAGLLVAAALFGLSHFNHGARFNLRYVLLATIAGVFYGRAWRANREIFASLVTHTAVDVVWSLWFR